MPDMEVPEMDIIPPYVVQFNKSVISRNADNIDTTWVQKVTLTLVNIDGRLQVNRCLESLLTYSKELSDKLLSHIHLFLKTRLPISKEELYPG